GVVRLDVATEPASLAVGDHVEARGLHVADRGVGRIVQHLVEVGWTHLSSLPGFYAEMPPAGAPVGTDDGGGDQRQGHRGHRGGLLSVVTSPGRERSAARVSGPPSMIAPDWAV